MVPPNTRASHAVSVANVGESTDTSSERPRTRRLGTPEVTVHAAIEAYGERFDVDGPLPPTVRGVRYGADYRAALSVECGNADSTGTHRFPVISMVRPIAGLTGPGRRIDQRVRWE